MAPRLPDAVDAGRPRPSCRAARPRGEDPQRRRPPSDRRPARRGERALRRDHGRRRAAGLPRAQEGSRATTAEPAPQPRLWRGTSELAPELVRAAMATRANQIGAGGAGIAGELLDALVGALNAGLTPFTRELGSLGTGDLTASRTSALALLGEGRVWRDDQLVDAATAFADAGVPPGALGPRDGLAFISSNAVRSGMPRCWSSIPAVCSTPGCRWPRCRLRPPAPIRARSIPASTPPATGPAKRRSPPGCEPAGRSEHRTRRPGSRWAIQDPYPFRALPQVDGAVHDALQRAGGDRRPRAELRRRERADRLRGGASPFPTAIRTPRRWPVRSTGCEPRSPSPRP